MSDIGRNTTGELRKNLRGAPPSLIRPSSPWLANVKNGIRFGRVFIRFVRVFIRFVRVLRL